MTKKLLKIFFLSILLSACSTIQNLSTNNNLFTIGDTLGATGKVAITATSATGQQIYLLDLNTKTVSDLVTNPGNNAYPAFSPDGKSLLFVSNRNGKSELYLASSNGQNAKQITFTGGQKFYPFWSPDGETAYFTHAKSNTQSNIFSITMKEINNHTYKAKNVTKQSGRNTAGDISKDGKTLAYTTDRSFPGWEICLLNLADSTDTCVLNKKPDTYCKPKWKNTTNSFSYSFGYETQISLAVYDPLTKTSTQLTHLTAKSYEPAWSKDDQYIIFSNDFQNPTTETYSLKIMRFSDNKIADLLTAEGLSLEYISWRDSTF